MTIFLVGSIYKLIISESLVINVEYIFLDIFSSLFNERSSSAESLINNLESCSKFGNNFNII